MRIKVLARTFFETRMGTRREAELFRKYRIISINNVSFPAEPPPVSPCFRNARNLLVLFFDDVEKEFPNGMTLKDAKRIMQFIRVHDTRPLLVHCTAGVSRSGALGQVLNDYFNCYLERNNLDYKCFCCNNRDIVPNTWCRKLLMRELFTPDVKCPPNGV